MRFFTTFQCTECGRPMTKTDFNFSLDLHRDGRCAPCQWDLDERLLQRRQDSGELTLVA